MERTTEDRALTRVFRPYTVLPPRAAWQGIDRAPYLDHLPDALAGLLRQYAVAMLDLGEPLLTPAQYKAYRKAVFDTRDQLDFRLREWLQFWGLVAGGRLTPAARAALVEAAPCAG